MSDTNSLVCERIAQGGVVGAGGAGFPTHVKLGGKADTVVINAAECEPLLHKDKELILARGEELAEGLAVGMQLTGAQRGIVGIKGKYKPVIDSLRPKLAKNMEIVPLDDAYPSGDEFILVYETLGRVIPPGGIPLAVGAVVMNVETAINVAASVLKEQPVTHKYVSVAGAVEHPCTVCVPIGTPLSACLKPAGKILIDDPCFIIGGVMMGTLAADLNGPVTKTTGGIIVLPRENAVVRRMSRPWKDVARIGIAACDQCSFCTELCPRNLLGHPIEPHRAMRSLGFNLSKQADVPGTQFCCECNLCSSYSCPEGLDPKNVCAENKRRLLAEKKRYENPPFQQNRASLHMKNRKTPTSRLMQRTGLTAYVNKGPLVLEPITVSEVTILLKQHIGALCQPTVRQGDPVRAGQTIAVRPLTDGKPALGADIHASVSGTVVRVEQDKIVIR
ncbi:MAG: 4Fe-4S dicluster domain-containing protein [Planctomycetaceae bacterium]|nr:4Fe-4S dicluster domain-containing protein [Planctomycetaceae bacterium]